ncbi:MAG: RHS repeat-associated core domain-containing protein [Phycisphaerae bacterium]
MGSAVLTTDAQSGSSNGARMSRRYFTAFGERVAELGEAGQPPAAWAASTFGYCGAFGYEGSAEWPTESDFGGSSGGGSGGSPSNDNFWESDLGVLHVGARWYWPETGRFLQRDPIGIRGRPNAFTYAGSRPLVGADPSGQMTAGIGLCGGLVVPGFALSGEVTINIGFDPQTGRPSGDLLISLGTGIGGGASASVGLTGTCTNACSTSQMTGGGWQGDAGIGPIGGAVFGGNGYTGGQGAITAGIGAGASIQGTYTIGVVDTALAVHGAFVDLVGSVIYDVFYH